MIELLFRLDKDEDDWPPFAIEGLWCEPQGELYKLVTCPAFVKGLSVGDIIRVQADEHHRIYAYDVVQPSPNTTIWLMVSGDAGWEDDPLARLRSLGCETCGPINGWAPRYYSVSVPGSLAIGEVDAIIQPYEGTGKIAVAYPSFRHEDRE